ncbi:helix-turn-helix domain-containing protein [Pseudoalteromonas tunicata]|uniref:helix-turn-helix domain-containing protein n=1 Tax=Pseudoalteromonas tunicata TaxID=314281 RepID=UPI0009FF616F|nr:AraC family transcriptional regulator [Pseudoalteromonas tunicata]
MGFLDYISYPIIKKELYYRVRCIVYPNDYQEYESNSIDYNIDIKSKLIEKTECYLKENLANNINLDVLTRNVGTNRNKLNNLFKFYHGISVFDWLREQRMKKAAELLDKTSLNIMQISERVGYPDSNNFSTAFKRFYQLSPRQYRQKEKEMQPSKKYMHCAKV